MPARLKSPAQQGSQQSTPACPPQPSETRLGGHIPTLRPSGTTESGFLAVAAFLLVRRRRTHSVPSPPSSTTSSEYEDRAAAKAAALWSERSSGEGGDLSGNSHVLRGSIADRLLNTKFDSESARSMVRMVRVTASLTAQLTPLLC